MQHALDKWDSSLFLSIFWLRVFSASKQSPRQPASNANRWLSKDMSNIEIFASTPKSTSEAPPLLFVHGACLGAWCWTNGFLDFFGSAGYYSIALNLRGHGGSSSLKPLQQLCIDDYVEDVASIAQGMTQPPVVIGHSMGGLIAQRFAARHPTSGVVLISPSPFAGMRSQGVRLSQAHPWQFFIATLTKDMSRIYPDNQCVRHIMFSPTTPEETVTYCRERLQKESWVACQEMIVPLKKPYPIASRILVLGGEFDGTVLPVAIRETAMAYEAQCHIFDGMGHNLMLEPSWEEVAMYIKNWLHQEQTT